MVGPMGNICIPNKLTEHHPGWPSENTLLFWEQTASFSALPRRMEYRGYLLDAFV